MSEGVAQSVDLSKGRCIVGLDGAKSDGEIDLQSGRKPLDFNGMRGGQYLSIVAFITASIAWCVRSAKGSRSGPPRIASKSTSEGRLDLELIMWLGPTNRILSAVSPRVKVEKSWGQ